MAVYIDFVNMLSIINDDVLTEMVCEDALLDSKVLRRENKPSKKKGRG
jgi:hypothetical protein